MSANNNFEGMTQEQLDALIAQAKEAKKKAKNKKQLLREEQMNEVKSAWEEIEWHKPDEMTNDERIAMLCECYGLKVAHRRQGRHQERPLGDASKRPNGQYSNIVANCEERFKYEVMGKSWRGRKIWEGKGKKKVYKGVEFDLQKAFKPVWGKLTTTQKKHWHHKFSNEWWKVGDDVNAVSPPTERTNSMAFMAWWDEHITREGDAWVFSGEEYDVDCDFMKYYDLATNTGGGEKPSTPAPVASKPAPAPKKTTKKQKKEDKYTAMGRKMFEDAKKKTEKKTEKKPVRKRRTKKEMAEAKAMGMEDKDAGRTKSVADMFEEEDLAIFSEEE